MTDEEILMLYAKDSVVETFKFAVLEFSKDTWEALVEGAIKSIPPNKILFIRGLYGDFE